jgi:hypothetical protein
MVDLRAAPPNTDPRYEAAIEPHRKQMVKHFSRTAILVRTAIGTMQVRKHMDEDGVPVTVFFDEHEAVRHLVE